MIERSAELGAYFKARPRGDPLEPGARGARARADAGGRAPRGGRAGAAGGARRCAARGILAKDTHGQTIRLAPPLVIARAEIDWALERIGAALV